ncbi:MAG: TolB family protein [Thermodesulfovibrionales bacterium]
MHLRHMSSSKYFIVNVVLISTSLLCIVACSKNQTDVEFKQKIVPGDVLATSTLLATIADNEMAPSGKTGVKHDPGAQNSSADIAIDINSKGRGVAYLAQVDSMVHVVHNGQAGKFYQRIENLTLSPDGQRVAYSAFRNNKWHMVVNGVESIAYDEVGPAAFSPDNRHIAYEVKTGDKWYIVADANRSSGCISYYARPEFSADSKKLVFVENAEGSIKMRIGISDLAFKDVIYKESAGVNLILSNDKSKVAAVMERNGKTNVIEFSFAQPEVLKESQYYDAVLPLVYDKHSDILTYCAVRNGIKYVIFDGKEEQLPEGEVATAPVVRTDKKGVALFLLKRATGYLHQAFYNDGKKSGAYQEAADLVYSSDSRLKAYCVKTAEGWKVICDGLEGPVFERVVTPQFSPDGKYLVYRARAGGKRFVVVMDTLSGKILKKHPMYDRVFETVFTEDGKSVAYGVVDGKQIAWKVEKLESK